MLFKKRDPEAPNFLSSYPFSSPQAEFEAGAMFLFVFLSVLLLFPFQQFQQLGVFLLGLLVLGALVIKVEWGIYALAFFAFFHGWEIAFSDYQFTQNISFLNSLNAPLVDFIALILLPCIALAFLFRIVRKQVSWAHLKIPTFFYACFLVVALVSALNTHTLAQGESLKYLGRPLVFIFFAFIFLPHFFIQSEVVLKRIIKMWFWLGVGIALFGLSSLFMVQQSGWLRIQPYGIGSFAPLGVNHNLIAQVLIALVPTGLWLMWEKRRKTQEEDSTAVTQRKFSEYLFGTGLMVVVLLGTLSRAAWISLFVQMVALFFLFRDQGRVLLEKAKKFTFPLIVLGAIFLIYMGFFLSSHVVSSSNSSRVEVTKIVMFYTHRAPWIGHGPGSFIPIIQDTYVHSVEFGDALDAHGLVQKMLMEEGILGLLFFGLFLVSSLYVVYSAQKKNKNPLLKILFVMTLGIMVFQLFDTSYFNSLLWMPLGVALTAVGVLQEKK